MALIKCSGCGHSISDKAAACPHCGSPVLLGNCNICKECGQQKPDNVSICPNCGCPTENAEVAQEDLHEETTKRRGWMWGLGIAALCLLGGLGYWGYTQMSHKENTDNNIPTVVEENDTIPEEKEEVIDPKDAIVELTPEFISALNKYDCFYAFSDGYAVVLKNNKWGYINTKGEEVIPTTINADLVGRFSDGLAVVAVEVWGGGGDFYVIDTEGNTVFKGIRDLSVDACGEGMDVDDIPYYIDGLLYVPVDAGSKYDVYDKQGNRTGTVDYDVAWNYYHNHETGNYTIFSMTHDDRYDDCEYDEDHTYGLKNLSGEIILAANYDMINCQCEGTTFFSNGVVYVELTEYDEDWDAGEDGHTRFHCGYADLKGNDTFSKALKDKCRKSKEEAARKHLPEWLQGAWQLQLTDDYGNCLGYTYEVFNDGTSRTYMQRSLLYEREYIVTGDIVKYNKGYYRLDRNRHVLIGADGREFTKVSDDRYFTPY